MKTGHLVGGIALGALVGVGVGYILGMDSEKKNQLIKAISDKVDKVFKGKCECGCDCEDCDCGESAADKIKKTVENIVS